MRRLQVTAIGHGYLALTVAIGVMAIVSGNPLLYLIESLFLATVIFSGILSERMISACSIEIHRQPCIADERSYDRIEIRNNRTYPVFCIEVLEWDGKKYHLLAFVPRIPPHTLLSLRSTQILERRGKHEWSGIALGTRYPFGFARKLKVIREKGERLVWPKRLLGTPSQAGESSAPAGHLTGTEISEGEVRPLTQDDDYRLVVWTVSAKGTEPLVRLRARESEDPEIVLDLRRENDQEFEDAVSRAAAPFHRLTEAPEGGTVTLVDWVGRKRTQGRTRALNVLATIRASGSSPVPRRNRL